MQTIFGDDRGNLINNTSFNLNIKMIDNYTSHSLNSFMRGKQLHIVMKNPGDDSLLYYGKNEEYDNGPEKLIPFVPFSKDSDGGFNSLIYSSNKNKGDIAIDCSYTNIFLEMEQKVLQDISKI